MAVEHSQTPGAHDKYAGSGKKNPDDLDGEEALFSLIAGRNQVDEERREEHTRKGRNRANHGEYAEDRSCKMVRVLILFPGKKLRIDGNESGR